MAGREVDPGPALEVDEDADWNETEDLDDGTEPLPPACDGGMSGWCGQLRKHSRCYFNHPDGITTVKAGMYGMWDGHQWVCTCPCHEIHAFPACPHPDHEGRDERKSAKVDYDVQQALF
jgi:hypothetical protein